MNKKDRIHDWRKLKWPFTATFLYYSLLSLYTGTAEQSEQGFLVMFFTVLIVDAVAYFSYCYFLCKKEENMQKLWFFTYTSSYIKVSFYLSAEFSYIPVAFHTLCFVKKSFKRII